MRNGREGEIPGDLPVYEAGEFAGDWDVAAGDAFWQQVASRTDRSDLAAQLDVAMAGKSAPRVWLILHQPDEPQLGALVALAFARELGSRDQATIVLDCDDRRQSLTRWAGRLETDGWIDVARYGASLMTAGLPLPFLGRKGHLLGVGSFAPTDVTEAEIGPMIARLRRQADDVILIAPADESGRAWATVAGIRLFCWDRAGCAASGVAALAAEWAEGGHPLTGLLGFGHLAATPQDVSETDEKAAVAADEFADEPADDHAEAPPEVDESRSGPDFEAPGGAGPAPGADAWREAAEVPSAGDGRRGTSGVFWFVLTAAVVTVAILGVYWFQYVRVPGLSEQESTPVAVRTEAERPVADLTTGELANQDDAPDDQAVADSLPGALDAAGGEPASDVTMSPETGTADESVVGDPVSGVEPVADEPGEAEFSMAPYEEEVGVRGWALHLYSVPSEASAEIELAELHRRGFETAVQVVETQEKGRWWRVYVGSFSSRAEATEAAAPLKEKLRTDWANPVRF